MLWRHIINIQKPTSLFKSCKCMYSAGRISIIYNTRIQYSFFFSPRTGMQKGYLKRQRSSLFLLAFLLWLKDSGQTPCWLSQEMTGKWSATPQLGIWDMETSGSWTGTYSTDTQWETMHEGLIMLLWAYDLWIFILRLEVHGSTFLSPRKRRWSTFPYCTFTEHSLLENLWVH